MPHNFGAKPSVPDHRDFKFQLAVEAPAPPQDVDLRAQGPLIWDQDQLGSCVSHGWLRAFNHIQRRQGERLISPSALFLYWNGRNLEGTTSYDSGLEVRDGGKALSLWGTADRFAWPYDISRFRDKPPASAYSNAVGRKALQYSALLDFRYIHNALQAGHPVVMGFSVLTSFEEVGVNGLVPMPRSGDDVLGGHCVLIEGYRKADDRFIIANSWGTYWADRGYCYFPGRLMDPSLGITFGSDFWVLEKVS